MAETSLHNRQEKIHNKEKERADMGEGISLPIRLQVEA
jgi:hypothetical protein